MTEIPTVDAAVPEGDLSGLWEDHRFNMKLVSPANKHNYKVLIVGTGLAGALAREKARQVFALAERLNTLEKTVERLLQDRNV